MSVEMSFLDVFDVYRVLIGTIAAEVLFVERAAPHRENFVFRVLKGSIFCLLFGLLYIPLFRLQYGEFVMNMWSMVITAVWWIMVSTVTICFIFYCYEITPCNLLSRCVSGLALEHLITIILQYLICKKWFPDLQEEHTVLYVLLTAAVYSAVLSILYFLLKRSGGEGTASGMEEDGKTFVSYCVIILFLSLISDVTNLIFYWSNYGDTWNGTIETLNHWVVPYYCITVNIIICSVIIILQFMTYRITSLQQERKMMQILQREKEQQYLFSRENIDIINQKCHDLKRQIRALKMVQGSEREKLFEETEKAVQFYDAQIYTGNTVLDTVLTEKSMLCAGKGIRFTCNPQILNPEKLNGMEVLDLYTLLSNGLDNAIECVLGYDEPEMRTISVFLKEKGCMLHIIVDNYFTGKLNMRNGLPVTEKADKNYHGYGVKSMQMIARKYDGDIRIGVQNQTFTLQIMIPLDV